MVHTAGVAAAAVLVRGFIVRASAVLQQHGAANGTGVRSGEEVVVSDKTALDWLDVNVSTRSRDAANQAGERRAARISPSHNLHRSWPRSCAQPQSLPPSYVRVVDAMRLRARAHWSNPDPDPDPDPNSDPTTQP